jgi:thiamine-phosphate pyrophosphorylase
MHDPHNLSRSLFMVTGPEGDVRALVDTVHAGIRGGVSHVVLRRPRQPASDLFRIAHMLSPSHREDAVWKLLVHERTNVALGASADGMHMRLSSVSGQSVRQLVGTDRLLGISVHDRGEAIAACKHQVDYLMFGHIYETPSHPGEPARGLDKLREVVEAVDIPVIAIGGVTARRVDEVLAAGAWGVAVIRAISGANDSEAAARELRKALNRAESPHLCPRRRIREHHSEQRDC